MKSGDQAITLDQWRNLSERVGGNLFKNPAKLEAMRSIDRICGSKVPWGKFCDLVDAKIKGQWIVSPTGSGKGLPPGSLPMRWRVPVTSMNGANK
jgi:hypothetical protein